MNTTASDIRSLARAVTTLDVMFCSMPITLLGLAILSLL